MKFRKTLISIIGICVLIIVCSKTLGQGAWNNDNFIDDSFWATNPSPTDIISALYGGGSGSSDTTAYTKYRNTNTCITGSMSVVYLSGGGLNTIPSTLSANTIYVLSGGTTYTINAIRNINNCSALIGNGDVTIQAITAGYTLLNANNAKNRVMDNIKIDRNYTGAVGGNIGLTIQGASSTSITINNSQFFNAGASYGIYNNLGTYVRINNTQVYNTQVAIYIGGSYTYITETQGFNIVNAIFEIWASSGIIDNCQAYNGFVGYRFNSGVNGFTINNSQAYNSNYGVTLASANNNIFNNNMIYNNGGYGISLGTGDKNILNNTWIYNNGNIGLYFITGATNTKYYGLNRIFNNNIGDIGGGPIVNLITGFSSDFPGLGRNDGTINTTAILTRDYITIPKNASGTYMQIRSGTFISARANKATSFASTLPIQYSYGSGTLGQQQVVAYFTGFSLSNRGTYSANKYIGSDATKITGDLIGIVDGANTPTNTTVTGTTTTSATKYNIFGEVVNNILGVDINTSTGIQIFSNNGSGYVRIIGDIYNPSEGFSTHFEKHPIREEPSNDTFVDPTFWNNNPNTRDIISRFFGGGANSTDKTAYTQNRTTNTCIYTNMSVATLSPGTDTIPTNLTANTIYILNPGTYITTATRNMATCSAILGKGNVEIRGSFATNTRLLSSASKQNWIVDNIKVNRNYTGASSAEAIYCSASSSVSINNSELYNGYHGFNSSACHYAQITNSKSYNNRMYGISFGSSNSGRVANGEAYNNGYGIVITSSSANTINDTKAYNNTNHGIYLNVSLYTNINNVKCFNNTSDGVYFFAGSNYNTINNSELYNNGLRGLDNFSNSNYNTVNNTQSYNNTQAGIYFASSYSGSINNSQSYNNGQAGFYFAGPGAGYFRVNNSQSYNNASDGIKFISATTGTINNTRSYNNDGYGVNVDSSSPANKYYGTIQMFGNTSAGIGGTIGNFTTGSNTDYPSFGRTAGNIDTSNNVSRDYLTNPINNSGIYLLNWTGSFTSLRGKLTYTGTSTMRYSYGSGILLQIQPVLYSGTTLIASGTFTGTNYIGSLATPTTGTLQGIGTYNGITSTVTGVANNPITTYSIFGDITSFIIGIPINTSTGIVFSGGIATGRVITQIYYSGVTFATHFQDITTIDTIGPNIPSLISPTDGRTISTSNVSLIRSTAIDTGVGIGGYIYQVSTTTGFTSFVITGNKTTTGVSLINFTNGTYYRRVYGYDLGGITGGRSTTRGFIVNIISTPIVGTGYISAGTTGVNGGTNYYKGTINIKASLSGQSITSCEYNIGGGRILANTGADYCEAMSLNPGSDIIIQFRATNAAGTTTGSATTYLYDTTGPTQVILLSPSNGSGVHTNQVNLSRSGVNDTGIGVSGYIYEIDDDMGMLSLHSGTTQTNVLLTGLIDGTYTRRMSAVDKLNNVGARSSSRTFDITTATLPVVSTGYISAGTTGANGGNNYYKGTINIKTYMTGTNITSCEYTLNGTTRLTASTGSNYCEVINLSPATDIHVQFRATNSAGTTTGGITNYIYDNTAPSDVVLASPANGTLVNTVSLQLTWNTATDTGIGTQGYHYIIALDSGFTTIIQQASTTSTNISLAGLADNTYYRKVYAYDKFGNTGSYSTTWSVDYSYTFGAMLIFVGINTPSLADKFSEVRFPAPGNSFGGSFFWLASKSISGGVDIIDAGLNTKNCTKLVRGLYYNSQRGKRIRPLDQYSLQLLKDSNPNYSELTITGGWYTSCTNDPYSIYGKITYNRSGGRDSDLIAGTKLIYQTNKADPYFAQSLQYFDNKTPIGFIRDSLGGIGFIGGELTDYNGLINDINNSGSIVSGFTYSGSTIISSTGGLGFTASTGINNASNTLWNLIVQGTVGLSQSLNNQERVGIMGNPVTKTVIYNSNDISNADIINEAAQNAEKLCKGKTWLTTNNWPNNYADDILCFNNTDLSIDLVNNASDFSNKTIIVRNGNVIMSNTMSNASPSLDLFIDQGNLYLNNTLSDMQNFDVQGYPDDSAVTNSGLFIRGNIIINGLIIGGSPGSETGFAHKLHLQGKLSSFNAPLAPTTGRITLIENLIGAQYIPYINLQNIFTRECGLLGIASDGSSCGSIGDISRTPLVIVDGKYSSRLLGN